MGTQGTTVIIPVPWKLAHDEQGAIICGAGTGEACDHAAELALSTPRSIILLTPTVPKDPKWNGVIMSRVMMEYIARRYPDIALRHEEAPTFNTHGEVIATVEYLKRCRRTSTAVSEIVYVVKSWHQPRLKIYVDALFSDEGISIPVRYETHDVPASFYDRAAREWLARIAARRALAAAAASY